MLLMTETKNEISTSTESAGSQLSPAACEKSWRAVEYKAPLSSVGANFLQLSPNSPLWVLCGSFVGPLWFFAVLCGLLWVFTVLCGPLRYLVIPLQVDHTVVSGMDRILSMFTFVDRLEQRSYLIISHIWLWALCF